MQRQHPGACAVCWFSSMIYTRVYPLVDCGDHLFYEQLTLIAVGSTPSWVTRTRIPGTPTMDTGRLTHGYKHNHTHYASYTSL